MIVRLQKNNIRETIEDSLKRMVKERGSFLSLVIRIKSKRSLKETIEKVKKEKLWYVKFYKKFLWFYSVYVLVLPDKEKDNNKISLLEDGTNKRYIKDTVTDNILKIINDRYYMDMPPQSWMSGYSRWANRNLNCVLGETYNEVTICKKP